MKNLSVAAVLAVAGSACTLIAQTNTNDPAGYHFEFRIIADGDAGAPTGNYPQFPLSNTATQIGFWIQARVSQTVNENWGITRVSAPPAPETSMLTVTDATAGTTLQRGQTNMTAAPNTGYGRGSGYRNGGPATGPTGNAPGSAAFPGIGENQNGAIDSGATRIYSYDAWVGATRNVQNADDPSNPWGVNGATSGGSVGNPVASNGTFSPWASVYRVMVLPTNVNNARVISLSAFAMIQGAIGAHPTDASQQSWAMEIGPGRNMTATYSFTWGIPTPGAAALLGMGFAVAGRRRR